MPPISASVYWSTTNNKGVVDKIHVPKANGATTIQWTCGTDVASFAISGLAASEFNPTAFRRTKDQNPRIIDQRPTDSAEEAV